MKIAVVLKGLEPDGGQRRTEPTEITREELDRYIGDLIADAWMSGDAVEITS